MDRLSLLLVIIGAINWGLVGLFQFDLVAFIFGGQAALISRVLYTIIGAAGVWSPDAYRRRKRIISQNPRPFPRGRKCPQEGAKKYADCSQFPPVISLFDGV